jgi:hypothetical protein
MTLKGPKDSPLVNYNMKKHTCSSCNFGSDDLSNFNRHNKSARHLAKCAMVPPTAAAPTAAAPTAEPPTAEPPTAEPPTTKPPTTKPPTTKPPTTQVQTAVPATMVPEPQTIAALVNLAADLSCQLNAIIELIKVQMHGPIAVQVPVAVPYDTEEGRVIKHLKDLRSAIAGLNQVPEPALEPVLEPEEVAEPTLEPVLEPVPEPVHEPVHEPEEVAEPALEPEEVPEHVAEPVEEVPEPVEEVPEEDVESVSDSEEEEEDESFDDTCSLILEQYGFKEDKKKGIESIKTVDSDVLWSLLPSKYRSLFFKEFEARASRILGKWKGSGPQFRDHQEILKTTLERYDTVERIDDKVIGPPMVRCKCCRDIFNTYMVTFHTCSK